MKLAAPDLAITGSLTDALPLLLQLAQLSQDGPLVGCVVCNEGSVWGYQEGGVKRGLHLRCAETGIIRGSMGTAAPEPAEDVTVWVWARLAGWYDH